MIFYFFQKLLLKKIFFLRIEKFVLSVSGGIDSLSLIFLLKPICYLKDIKFLVIIIDHRSKYFSYIEAKQVSCYLNTYQIKNKIFFWFHTNIVSNFQCFAHIERYKFIYSYCYFNKVKYLFLGHTSNDQSENILLKIIRRYSVCNMKFLLFINPLTLLRPLIFFTKNSISNFAKKNNLFWFEDKSNNNINFNRIKFRNLIFNFNYKINLSKKLILVNKYFRDSELFLSINFFLYKYFFFNYLSYFLIKKYIFILKNINFQKRMLKKILNKFLKKVSLSMSTKIKSVFFLNNLKRYSILSLLVSNCYIFSDRNHFFFYRNIQHLVSVLVVSNYINIFNDKYVLFSNISSFKISYLQSKLLTKKSNKKKFLFSYFIIFSKVLNIYLVPLQNVMFSFSNLNLVDFHLYIENNLKKIYIKLLFHK